MRSLKERMAARAARDNANSKTDDEGNPNPAYQPTAEEIAAENVAKEAESAAEDPVSAAKEKKRWGKGGKAADAE